MHRITKKIVERLCVLWLEVIERVFQLSYVFFSFILLNFSTLYVAYTVHKQYIMGLLPLQKIGIHSSLLHAITAGNFLKLYYWSNTVSNKLNENLNYDWFIRICQTCSRSKNLFISIQIIVQKWNWYQSSWIIVYFSLML